jgi:hypothetical protein
VKTLTDPIPLRTTAEWPGFRDAVALPVRVGVTRGKLIQYSQDRTQWVWAGHAGQAVDVVSIGGLPVDNWVWDNVIDAAGKPVMMVTFDAPVDEGSEPTAQGRGLQDATTGILIENPAAALFAILSDLGGLAIDREQLSAFRAETAAAQIIVGGSIETADSGQTFARALCSSIGAKFGSAARSLAFLWPGMAQPVRYTVSASSVSNTVELTRAAALSDFCNDLTIQYDFDGDQPRGSIRLVAPAQVARYGATAQTLAARWITSAGVAQRVGARLLGHSARKVWLVTASGIEAPGLRIGDSVQFQHALLTDSGACPVLSREANLDTGAATITARVAIGAAPTVAIASQSSYFDVNAYVSADVQTIGPDRIFTIRDSDGVTPLAGCAVQILPSGITKPTDAQGKVSFTVDQMPAGHHYDLGVTTADGRYFTFGFDV